MATFQILNGEDQIEEDRVARALTRGGLFDGDESDEEPEDSNSIVSLLPPKLSVSLERVFKFDCVAFTLDSNPAAGLSETTWRGGLACAKWLAEEKNHKLFHGKSVLELGAGTGICGLMCAYSAASKVVITDCSHEAMALLRKAIVRMPLNISAKTILAHHLWEVDEQTIEWQAEGCELLSTLMQPRHWCNGTSIPEALRVPALDRFTTYDLVIAADCIYQTAQESPLAASIFHRLAPNGVAVVCITVRVTTVIDRFRQHVCKTMQIVSEQVLATEDSDVENQINETETGWGKPIHLMVIRHKPKHSAS